MKTKSEKSSTLKQEEIIEQQISELGTIAKNLLDTANRLNEQIQYSTNLITEVHQHVGGLNNHLEGMEERVEVQASKSSCRLF